MTADDNVFQVTGGGTEASRIAATAFDEVTRVVSTLENAGIRVHLFDDESLDLPDSVFPNNWVSTHPGGHVAIYPMYAQNRRGERRSDVIDMLKNCYRVQDVIDYSGLELDDVFLEGTGAVVLDHVSRVAYVARSNRADPIALERFCTNFGYEPMVFDAIDPSGMRIYHTNVMMGVATDFALVGLDLIQSPSDAVKSWNGLPPMGARSSISVSSRCANSPEMRSNCTRQAVASSRSPGARRIACGPTNSRSSSVHAP